jgi:hypothetical protein
MYLFWNGEVCGIHLLFGKIITKNLIMREDLMCFASFYLIVHYEMGKDFNLESQLKSTYKFLLKMNDLQEVQKKSFGFEKSEYFVSGRY